MSALRPDIAREFGEPTKKPGDDTEAALERNADHVPADDTAEPETPEEDLRDTVRRQDEARKG